MRSVHSWFDEYGESHRHPVNKRIHWVCVPLIFFSVLALIWALPTPLAGLNWAVVAAIAVQGYYIVLSPRLSIGIAAFMALSLALCGLLDHAVAAPLWLIALVIFILAWIGQFIGHRIEGRKPSFFRDLAFLLIGPAWLMGFIYRRLGWAY